MKPAEVAKLEEQKESMREKVKLEKEKAFWREKVKMLEKETFLTEVRGRKQLDLEKDVDSKSKKEQENTEEQYIIGKKEEEADKLDKYIVIFEKLLERAKAEQEKMGWQKEEKRKLMEGFQEDKFKAIEEQNTALLVEQSQLLALAKCQEDLKMAEDTYRTHIWNVSSKHNQELAELKAKHEEDKDSLEKVNRQVKLENAALALKLEKFTRFNPLELAELKAKHEEDKDSLEKVNRQVKLENAALALKLEKFTRFNSLELAELKAKHEEDKDSLEKVNRQVKLENAALALKLEKFTRFNSLELAELKAKHEEDKDSLEKVNRQVKLENAALALKLEKFTRFNPLELAELKAKHEEDKDSLEKENRQVKLENAALALKLEQYTRFNPLGSQSDSRMITSLKSQDHHLSTGASNPAANLAHAYSASKLMSAPGIVKVRTNMKSAPSQKSTERLSKNEDDVKNVWIPKPSGSYRHSNIRQKKSVDKSVVQGMSYAQPHFTPDPSAKDAIKHIGAGGEIEIWYPPRLTSSDNNPVKKMKHKNDKRSTGSSHNGRITSRKEHFRF